MTTRLAVWGLTAFTLVAVLPGQKQTFKRGPHRMEIVLEQRTGDDWVVRDPGHVFENGDRVRFRLTTNFAGYLYVMNHGTSGDYSLLFPRKETGRDNEIEADQEYVVPATEGAFRITGPAGHEVVYWVVSPVEWTQGGGVAPYRPLPPPPEPSPAPPRLEPRCDETILRARGDCVDPSAGLQKIEGSHNLPQNLKQMPHADARQLLFLKKDESSVVSAPPSTVGPVVFEFRLAHR